MIKFKKALVAGAILGVTVAGTASLTSCNSGVSEKDLFTISYNLSDPNMSGLWKPGLETASEAEGFNKIQVADAKNDDAECLKMVEAAATENYGAYLINVVDDSNGQQYVNKIKETGKPLVFWNRELKNAETILAGYDKAYYVGIESAEGGRYQGKMAADYINETGFEKLDRNGDGKIGVVVVRGEKGHADAEARTLNAPLYLEKNLTGGNPDATAEVSGVTYTPKDFNKVDVKAIVDGTDTAGTTWEPVTAASEVQRVLNEKGDEIDLVLSNNDGMALGIITNAKFKEAGIPIFGVDALDDALQEIKKEDTQFKGTVKNDGKKQAAVVVKVAKNLINGDDASKDLTVVTSKDDWNKSDDNIWYDAKTKAFRVHHLIITKDNA